MKENTDYSAIFNDGTMGWKRENDGTMETMESAIFAVFTDYSAVFNDGTMDEGMERWKRWKARFSLFSPIIALFSTMERWTKGWNDGTMESAIFAVFTDYSAVFAVFGPSRLYWR